jgi:hypothetical protein
VFLIVYNHPQSGPVYLARFQRRSGGRARCKFSRRRDNAQPYGSSVDAGTVRGNLVEWFADGDPDRATDLLQRIDIIPANRPDPTPE